MKCIEPREGTKPTIEGEYIILGLCPTCQHWSRWNDRSPWGDCEILADQLQLDEEVSTPDWFGCRLHKERR